MTDILIKGMEIPKDCPQCPLSHWNKLDVLTGCELVWRYVPESETDYWQSNTRPDWCPLVEVPHGRLVDENDFFSDDIIYPYKQFEKAMKDFVSDMPTVIEASDSNEYKSLDKEEE